MGLLETQVPKVEVASSMKEIMRQTITLLHIKL